MWTLNRAIKTYYSLSKQGKGNIYVSVDFICFARFELWDRRKKRELQNEKFLSTAEFEPTLSRLLDSRSNRLS